MTFTNPGRGVRPGGVWLQTTPACTRRTPEPGSLGPRAETGTQLRWLVTVEKEVVDRSPKRLFFHTTDTLMWYLYSGPRADAYRKPDGRSIGVC